MKKRFLFSFLHPYEIGSTNFKSSWIKNFALFQVEFFGVILEI
jgi:hypothetical protein